MYKNRRLTERGSAEGEHSPFVDKVVIARSMSYYVKGGVDLEGVSNRKSLPDAFDDAETISSGDVDIFTDSTLGKLDILDAASRAYSDAEARALKDGVHEPNSD